MALTATGLGSGLDINGLVNQLVAAERAGSDLKFTRESTKLNAKLSALGSFKSAMGSLQSSLASLNNLSSFEKRSATLSDATAVGAVAKAGAVPATYSLEVNQLATSHALAGPAVAGLDTPLGTGTLTFRFGTTDYDAQTDTYNGFTLKPDSKITTITLDETNNTLAGLMTAINDGKFGVSASIVKEGTGYRLLLSSNQNGAANSIEITANDDDGDDTDMAGLSRFAFNAAATNASQTFEARNAEIRINGLPITATSNTLGDTIPNVDLTLKAVTTSPVTLSVREDTAAATTAVQNFIGGYNNFVKTIKSLTSYNASTNTAGTLLGDFQVRSVVSQVDNILRNSVAGLVGNFSTLADIGITTDKDGQYVLDSAKFTEAVKTAPKNVRGLFAADGRASDMDITYTSVTPATVAGSYAVSITSLATAGRFNGAGVLPVDFGLSPLVIDADNRSLTLEVDGVSSGELLLTEGSYDSGEALAAELQARINGAGSLVTAGVGVTVTYDATGNRFSIVSNSLGELSTVNVLAAGANVATTLGFDVADGDPGTNVAGTIGGVAGIGVGNVLTGADDTDMEGLAITVAGTTTGNRGTVTFTRGVTARLDELLKQLLDTEGSLETRISAGKERQTSISERKQQYELRWEAVRKRYLAQFNALDTLMAKLNSTSNFLTGQLASLPGVVRKD